MRDPTQRSEIVELPEPTLGAIAGGGTDYVMPEPDDP